MEQYTVDELKRLLEDIRRASEGMHMQIQTLLRSIDRIIGPSTLSSREISGAERLQLCEALLSAFSNYGQLTEMVRYRLDENLHAIAGTGTLKERVYELIEWAVAEGRIEELVEQAYSAKPGNPKLRDFTQKYKMNYEFINQTKKEK